MTAAEQIVTAAEKHLRHFRVDKTSMEDIAEAAGVSRATLYRHVGDRNQVILAVAVREANALSERARTHLACFDGVDDWLVEGMLFSLRELPKQPVLSDLFATTDARTASQLVLHSGELLELGMSVVQPVFERAAEQGRLREGLRMDMLIEWLLRILWTYLNAPGPRASDEDAMRDLFRTMLLPAVLKEWSET